MVGDEVYDPALLMVATRWLLVKRGLHPSRPRELQQRSRQESADCVFGDLPVDPVVVVAVSPEKRRGEVEDMVAPYHERRVQPRADRRLGVARQVMFVVLRHTMYK